MLEGFLHISGRYSGLGAFARRHHYLLQCFPAPVAAGEDAM